MTTKTTKSDRIPQELESTFEDILGYINEFCTTCLNDEYAQLLHKLALKLARKRPSPLLSGNPKTWAAGMIHALGMVNFLFDPSQKPHVKSSEISQHFGLAQNTISAKSQNVRKLFKMYQLDPEWMLPSRIEDSPMTWFIIVNGMPMDARYAPLEIQLKAVQVGAIPYLPKPR